MGSLFLGIDCGLTSIKTVLFDCNGNSYGLSSEKNSVVFGKIDTKALWEKVILCIKETIKDVDVEDIKGIGVSGHGNGLYFSVNEKPSNIAYSSMYKGIDVIDSRISNITLQSTWNGQPLNILAKIKKEDYKLFNSIDKIFFCKDYIKYMLTGEYSTDYSDASAGGLLDNNSYTINKDLFRFYDLEDVERLIPKIFNSYEVAGKISIECSNKTGLKVGTPVVAGAFDVCSCIVGSGLIDYDKYSVIAGTWGVNSALSDKKINDRDITQCCSYVDKEINLCVESAPTSCVNLEWFIKNIRPDITYDMISDIAKHKTDLIYLPYVYAPMRYPTRKASFVNLSIEHNYKDMIVAIMEGVAFGHKKQIEALKKVGIIHKQVVLSGGIANSEEWCQILADVLNMQIITLKEKQCGALGGAMLSAIACGKFNSLKQATLSMIKQDKVYYPKANYDIKYNEFCKYLGE